MNIVWKTANREDSLINHWCDLCFADNILRFKVFCRKSDTKCFIEDVIQNTLTEFDGAKGVANRTILDILKKEEPKKLTPTEEKIQKCYTEIWKTQMYPVETKGKPKGDDILKREFKWLK